MESMLHQLIAAKDVRSSDMASTSTHMSNLEKTMSRLEISRENVSRDLALVRSLGFKARTVRHDAIPVAHQQTFQWVFQVDGCDGGVAGSGKAGLADLAHWLEIGDGVFWVSGKPGSGKSTFMKFIADHPQTNRVLSQWSHPYPVVIASHYFWSAGTDMQKSQQGLLRSLLYDVFSHCPELGQIVCQPRWAASENDSHDPWTLSELRATLRAISNRTEVKRKFCFFIDGLDEFKGDHIDFCEDLVEMMDSPSIKFCVSSRPWNVFEDFFGQDSTQKLYIHELTKSDIAKYAKDRLHQHRRWRHLASRTPRAESLVDIITEKSQGVFLWVFIVTQILRESLTNDDSFVDLQRRLDSFPADLEPFFKQILESVPEFYKEKMVTTLQIALAAKEPLDAVIYSFNDEADDGLNHSLDISAPEYDPEIIRARHEQVARRLNGRCRCLLEFNFLGQIDFLHRTVVDFLRTGEMSDYLSERTPKGFCPNLAIFKAHTAWLKTTGVMDGEFSLRSYIPGTTSGLVQGVSRALSYAASSETDGIADQESIDFEVDDMEHTVSTLTSGVSPGMGYDRSEDMVLKTSFQEMVLETSLMRYFSRKISRDHTFLSVFKQPAIMTVLCIPRPKPQDWPTRISEKLECLFRNGYSPHELVSADASAESGHTSIESLTSRITVWEWFMQQNVTFTNDEPHKVSMGPRLIATLRAGLFQLFLQNGVRPNALWAPERSALEGLLSVAFSLPTDAAIEKAYLRAIDSFIQYGAKINKPREKRENPMDQTLAGPMNVGGDKQMDISPGWDFLESLEINLRKSAEDEPERLLFLLEVMQKVISIPGGRTNRLLTVIDECSATIRNAPSTYPQSVSLKRGLAREDSSSRLNKIARQY